MKKNFILLLSATLLVVALGYKLFYATAKIETIFDKIVSIPEKIIYDVPYLPPHCDEIADLKTGFADIKDGKLVIDTVAYGGVAVKVVYDYIFRNNDTELDCIGAGYSCMLMSSCIDIGGDYPDYSCDGWDIFESVSFYALCLIAFGESTNSLIQPFFMLWLSST